MRLVAENDDEYVLLGRLQKVCAGRLKDEQASGTPSEALIQLYKKVLNTPIERPYLTPGSTAKVANSAALVDTDERHLIIPTIVRAATERKQIAIEYKGKDEVKKRVVEPFNWKGKNLVAFCHEAGAWRHFTPENILRIAMLDIPFVREEVVEIVAQDAVDRQIQ